MSAVVKAERGHGVLNAVNVFPHDTRPDHAVNPHNLVGRRYDAGRRRNVAGGVRGKAKRGRSVEGLGRLNDRRASGGRCPAVLSGDVAGVYGRKLERLEKRERLRLVSDERIKTPRNFKSVGKPVAVGVRQRRRGAEDAAFERVWDAVAVRVASRVGDQVCALGEDGRKMVTEEDLLRGARDAELLDS